MKSKFLWVFIILILPVMLLCAYLYNQYHSIRFPFKCLYTTDYNLMYEGKMATVHLTQDIRLYQNNTGYFLLNGYVRDASSTPYLIRRSLSLNTVREIQGKTFIASITETSQLTGDTVSDTLMNELLEEYLINNNTLQVDIFHLHERTWLIGGPYAFLGTCLRY